MHRRTGAPSVELLELDDDGIEAGVNRTSRSKPCWTALRLYSTPRVTPIPTPRRALPRGYT